MTFYCGCSYTLPTLFNTSHQPNGRFSSKRWLPQVKLDSHTEILLTTSRTKLTQKFVNDGEPIPEVAYTFPLYDGVSVVSFKCTVGRRVITGVVKEKQQARTEYNQAVERGETAGLLEQLPEASDVFTTKIGNVPKDQAVIVELEYLGELKHDAELDCARFTIPTSIAPRYGNLSESSAKSLQFTRDPTNHEGMNITVDVSVGSASQITSIGSVTHPIKVTLGRISAHAEDTFNSSNATASLSLAKAELDKDFVVQISATGQDTPQALIETHSSLPNQRALMATLVPKFNLPNIHPEIVFVVDRSGSMSGSIRLVVDALQIFLKSLPTSAKFNIYSFGNFYTPLFPKSRSYDEQSLKEAIDHIKTFDADYGGTQLLPPLTAVIKERLKGVPLEIMVLTDGEIWNQQTVFDLLNTSVKDQIRLFSLGIGHGASSSLVEGLARAGNGFAQFVHDGESLDKRVVRMLKASLTPHIHDYQLQVKYAGVEQDSDDDFEMVESVNLDETAAQNKQAPMSKPTISLWNSGFKEEKPNPTAGRYDHLPKIAQPSTLQAPHSIPPLYSYNRTCVYLLLGPEQSQRKISSVILRGTCEAGPLELEIAVQDAGAGQRVHQLAVKKTMQELEQGRGWLSEVKSTSGELLKGQHEADWDRIIEREAVRLGVQFQVAGKFCSFVAVENGDVVGTKKDKDATQLVGAPYGAAVADAELDLRKAQSSDEDMGFGLFDHDPAPAPTSANSGIRPYLHLHQTASSASGGSVQSPARSIMYRECLDSTSNQPGQQAVTAMSSPPQPRSAQHLAMRQGQVAQRCLIRRTAQYSQNMTQQYTPQQAMQSQTQQQQMMQQQAAQQQQQTTQQQMIQQQVTMQAQMQQQAQLMQQQQHQHAQPPQYMPMMPSNPAPSIAGASGNHALQDYQMQLMLLEQQNKKRLMMARQDQHFYSDTSAAPPGAPAPVPAIAPTQSGSAAADPTFQLDFSTLENTDVLEKFDFDNFLNRTPGQVAEASFGQPEPNRRQSMMAVETSKTTSGELKVRQIIDLQNFDGSWKDADALLNLIGISRAKVEASSMGNLHSTLPIKITTLALAWLEDMAPQHKEVWELVADKARLWLSGQPKIDNVDAMVTAATRFLHFNHSYA